MQPLNPAAAGQLTAPTAAKFTAAFTFIFQHLFVKKALTRIQIVWKLQKDWLYLFACSYRLSLLLVFVRSKAKHDLGMENTKQLFLYIIYIHVVNTGNGQSFFCLTGMDIRAGRRRTQCLSNIEKHTHTLTRSGSPLSEWWKSKTWSHLISLSDMFVPVGPETDEDTQKRLRVCVCVSECVRESERVLFRTFSCFPGETYVLFPPVTFLGRPEVKGQPPAADKVSVSWLRTLRLGRWTLA